MNTRRTPGRARLACERGFGIIEVMVAVTIGLLLTLGFTSGFINIKGSFISQDQLAQLQDNERLALTAVAGALQTAGYFPDPVLSTAVDSLPASTNTTYGDMLAGQGVVGTTGTTDTLTVRFSSASGDGLTNCLGQTNTSGAKQTIVNIFKVNASKELQCSADGGTTFTTLVSNVAGFSVAYLADTDPDGSVEAFKYQSASAITAASLWTAVKAARVTITFVNPYAATPGQPATISWVQTVALMNKT